MSFVLASCSSNLGYLYLRMNPVHLRSHPRYLSVCFLIFSLYFRTMMSFWRYWHFMAIYPFKDSGNLLFLWSIVCSVWITGTVFSIWRFSCLFTSQVLIKCYCFSLISILPSLRHFLPSNSLYLKYFLINIFPPLLSKLI